MMVFLEKNKKKMISVLWAAVVLASIKSIFTDTGFDNAYTVAMSFRHLRGDGMFAQMWEPHQTSIFFTDFFMWIYHLFVPSYTGVVIYLQIVGTAFYMVIGFFLYKMLKTITGSDIAQLAAMFFIMFRAKQTPFPDYANLQIGFSALLFLCLISYIREQHKKRYLCLAAVFLCLEILSYPSCLLAWLPAVLILFWKTRDRWKNVCLFTGICALFGGIYLGYFICKGGAQRFLQNLKNIFYSDSHSGEAFVSSWNYFSGILTAFAWLLLCAALAGLMLWISKKLLLRSVDFFMLYGFILFLSEIVFLFIQKKTGLDWTCTFYIIPAFLMALSCFFYKEMSEQEKNVWQAGSLFAIVSCAAAWLLTDLGLITMVSYMVLGGVVSFVALRHRKKQIELFLIAICSLIIVHRGLVVWGYANKDQIWMVQDITAMITSGPSIGIVSDYMTYYQTNCDLEDHGKFLTPEDSLFLVGHWLIDPMEFLLANADISNYSTIDTPTYNERLLDYLDLYPEKKPTVVAVSCFYGQMQVKEDTWIMQWIHENYEAVGDGRYWRYYREKEALEEGAERK